MAYIPRSSFVPKEASSAIPLQIKKKRTVHVLSLMATIVLCCSVIAAVGAFLYNNFLDGQLALAQKALSEISDENNEEKIEKIRLYDEKLKIANDLLNNHIAPSRVFRELEEITKETVQFQGLKFSYDPGFDAELTLEGVTEKFAFVFLQKMQIAKDGPFVDFVVQDLSLFENSNESTEQTEFSGQRGVGFSIRGLFKNEVLSYRGDENSSASVNNDIGEDVGTDTVDFENSIEEIESSASDDVIPQL